MPRSGLQSPMTLIRLAARLPEAVWAPVLEAFMVLVAGVFSVALRQAWLFSSLGPTAFEIAEHPQRPSSRPWAIVVGHFSAIAVAFGAVALFGAWHAPLANPMHGLTRVRLLASVIAALVTAAINLILKTNQPASLATALLITLGSFQSGIGALELAAGVILVALLGIPLRQLGIKRRQEQEKSAHPPAMAV